MDQSKEEIRRPVLSALRRTMLFSIGSALIFQEKIQEFVDKAVERGQETQKEGKELVQEMRSKKKKPRDVLDSHITEALERLDVASQKDIEELNQHIAALSKRVDELQSG